MMSARAVPTVVLLAVLAMLQGQLWLGRGSLPRVHEMQRQIAVHHAANTAASQANARLDSDVNDLNEGLALVEEKARSDLGMVKPNEIYVQYLP